MAKLKVLDGGKSEAPKVFKPPKEWSDPNVRKECASYLIRIIDTGRSDGTLTQKFARYQMAQDVFDDYKILSKVDLKTDIAPYQVPLLRQMVKGVSRLVVSAFNGADPYYIVKGGDTDSLDVREAIQKDLQLILEADSYRDKIRETARTAAIWCRGPFRITWQKRMKGEGWASPTSANAPDVEFAGPARETILPQDLGMYPLSQIYLTEMRAIWHRFDRPMYEIWAAQDSGEYFSRDELEVKVADGDNVVTVQAQHEQKTAAEFEEDYAPNLYHMIVKLWPGMDKTKPMRAYRVVIAYAQEDLLAISEYDEPTPEYFAPGFDLDPMEFWATNSVASSVFELQSIINDITTARIEAGVAATHKTIFVKNYTGEMTSFALDMGSVIPVQGNPDFFQVDTSNPPTKDLAMLSEEMRREMEGTAGFSQISAGQLPPANQTATASGIAANATSDEGEEKRQVFLAEEVRAVKFIQHLCAKHYEDLQAFYGDRLKTKSAEEWRFTFEIAPNGQGPENNPVMTLSRMDSLLKAAQVLKIPTLQDVEKNPSLNIGVAIDVAQMFKAMEQNVNLPMNTEKIIVDTSQLAGFAQGSPLALPAPGETGAEGFPPELLAALAQAGAGGALPLPEGGQAVQAGGHEDGSSLLAALGAPDFGTGGGNFPPGQPAF